MNDLDRYLLERDLDKIIERFQKQERDEWEQLKECGEFSEDGINDIYFHHKLEALFYFENRNDLLSQIKTYIKLNHDNKRLIDNYGIVS